MAFCSHALAMSFWIFLFDRSPFCSTSLFFNGLFSIVLGFVFIFNYILPKMTQTRYRFAAFYTISFIENVVCVTLFVFHSPEEDKQAGYFIWLCIFAIVPFLLGIIFMIVYYKYFHPNVVIRRRQNGQEVQQQHERHEQQDNENKAKRLTSVTTRL